MSIRHLFLGILAVGFLCEPAPATPRIHGALRTWHPLEIQFEGPQASESDTAPNPFLDFRLQVRFTAPNGSIYDVPGFFNGDGAGNGAGKIWSVRFTPDQPGPWSYRAVFRQGKRVVVGERPSSDETNSGAPVAFDGISGTFEVQPRDVEAPGFFKWGRLEY
ncbi:MAG: DUF5060 domain-containing protein, partial [Phycisphaerales bacterium]